MGQSLIQLLERRSRGSRGRRRPLAGRQGGAAVPRHRRRAVRPRPRLPARGAVGAGRLPFAPRARGRRATAAVRGWPSRCRPALARARLAAGHHQLADRRRDLPVARRAHRLRRPDLAGPDGASPASAGFTLSKLATEYGVGRSRSARCAGAASRPRLRPRSPPSPRCASAASTSRSSRWPPRLAIENLVFENPSLVGRARRRAACRRPRLVGLASARTTRVRRSAITATAQLPNPWFGVFCLVVVVVLALLVVNLRRSAHRSPACSRCGRNERAAAAAGVNVAGTKLLAFALSRVHRRPRRRALRLPVRLGHAAVLRQPRLAHLPRLRLPRRHLERHRRGDRRAARRRRASAFTALDAVVRHRRPSTRCCSAASG